MNPSDHRPAGNAHPDLDQARRPKEGPTETHYEKEAQGHEGTLGGQPPLHAPAGIQRAGRGGVLVEKSPHAADDAQLAREQEKP